MLPGMRPAPSSHDRATWVLQRLQRFTARLAQGRARPGELSVVLCAGGYALESGSWFMQMAREALRRKYRAAARPDVVAALDVLEQTLAVAPHARRQCRLDLLQGQVRVAQRATRWRCDDPDLFAATGHPLDLTAWVFHGPDLRYRVQDKSLTRLAFMIDCWSVYATEGLTASTRDAGLPAFPAVPALRPPLFPPRPARPA